MSLEMRKLQPYESINQEPSYTLLPCKHKAQAYDVMNRIMLLSVELEKQSLLCPTCNQKVTIVKTQEHKIILSPCLVDSTPLTKNQIQHMDTIDNILGMVGKRWLHCDELQRYIPSRINVFSFAQSNCSAAMQRDLNKK